MTSFKSYPHKRVTLPAGGKVAGEFELIFRGNGSGMVRTDAHINDTRQAIDFRGESWLVTLELTRLKSGDVIVNPDLPWGDSRGMQGGVTRRSNWSKAPTTYAGAIVAAILQACEDAWTDEDECAGLEADVAQRLHWLEREEAELAESLRKVRKSIRAQHKRLV